MAPPAETERLYYQDAYIRQFEAQVIAHTSLDGRPCVVLDRTAFYPTGGGQPNDTGFLDGIPVIDVNIDEGRVWHTLQAELPHTIVKGLLDWPRRFDHMQQHTGQHVLSQSFVQECDAETVAFHLGTGDSTIDLNRTDLDPSAIRAVEQAANAIVDAALPVTASFVDAEAIERLPLRRPPKTSDAVRIVQVDGFDWSACGGTHVSNTSQIGLIKITATERRGLESRVHFVCGRRARADYTRLQGLVGMLAARFTIGQDDLPGAVEHLWKEHRAVRKELTDLEGQFLELQALALWDAASVEGGRRVLSIAVDFPMERAKRLAQLLRARPATVVLLGIKGERPQLIFARSDDVDIDMGDLLRRTLVAVGGRGGGRPDWAQGGAPDNAALEKVLSAAQALAASLA